MLLRQPLNSSTLEDSFVRSDLSQVYCDPSSPRYIPLDTNLLLDSQGKWMSHTVFSHLDPSSGTKQFSDTSYPQQYTEDFQTFIPSRVWKQQDSARRNPGQSPSDSQVYQGQSNPTWWQMPSHERAHSNGSVHSYASVSPYSAASSFQHPSTINTTRTQHLSPQDAMSSPTSTNQHLPTPLGTPTQDSMSRSNPRRTASSIKTDSANTAQQAFRQSSSQHSSGHGLPSRYGAGSGWAHPHEGPITPKTANGDEFEAQPHLAGYGETNFDWDSWHKDLLFDEPVATRHVPKFDRTMSDIYQDELYDPTSLPAAPATNASTWNSQFLAPNHSTVNQLLQQANQARSGFQQPPRQSSPYRPDSTWGVPVNGFSETSRVQTAAGLREQQKAENDALVYRQHHPQQVESEEPTISPKDAFPMEMNIEEDMPSLFPGSSQQSGNGDMSGYGQNNAPSQAQFDFSMPTSTFSFATPGQPASATAAENRQGLQYRPESSGSVGPVDFPAPMPSMETTRSDYEEDDDDDDESSTHSDDFVIRPNGSNASRGTYTCTNTGCAERFDSVSRLQTHRRSQHPTTGSRPHDSPQSHNSIMSQAGPHKCTRLNPSTGKPCNTVFSRPYDLTRHEDTIHRERQKVRCEHCTEEKLFSRADALTRHLRVVHPHVAFQGKHRRRAME